MSKTLDTSFEDLAESVERPKSWRKLLTPGTIALLLGAVALAATGQLLLKHGMRTAAERASATESSLVIKAATSPWIMLGLSVFAISAVAWLAILSRVPLSIAYPFNALGFLAVLISSAVILNERTNIWTWVGTSCVVAGIIIVVTTKPT